MDALKTNILVGLRAFVAQRAGIEPGNYGSWADYRAESRSVTRDLHDARELLRAVEWRDSITGEMLRDAFKHAFSGRLSCEQIGESAAARLSYCTGRYFPTEYRKAACAVLASCLWTWTRELAMPAPLIPTLDSPAVCGLRTAYGCAIAPVRLSIHFQVRLDHAQQ